MKQLIRVAMALVLCFSIVACEEENVVEPSVDPQESTSLVWPPDCESIRQNLLFNITHSFFQSPVDCDKLYQDFMQNYPYYESLGCFEDEDLDLYAEWFETNFEALGCYNDLPCKRMPREFYLLTGRPYPEGYWKEGENPDEIGETDPGGDGPR